MSASVSPISNNISEAIEKLRRLSRWDVQSGWKYCYSDSALVPTVNICNWPRAELNEKSHIAWPSGKQILYLGQLFIVPGDLSGYPVTGLRLLLSLTWWAEDAQLFVNGELVGVGDLFDCSVRLLLSPSAIPGDEFSVILRLVSPGHDAGALVRSICLYESANSACFDPGFVADELEILQNLLSGNFQNLNSQYVPTQNIVDDRFVVKGERLKSEIELAVGLIDWSVVCDRQKFDRSLSTLRQNLVGYLRDFQDVLTAEGAEGAEGGKEKIFLGIGKIDDSIAVTQFPIPNSQFPEQSNLSEKGYTSIYIGEGSEKSSIYQGKIYLLGHAHLDLAWLWPVEETWEAAQRTFESALKLQSEFPDLIFCHSTPALYAWIEEHRPDLFAAIKKQVAAGRWEVVGGMWVEPDLNLISAESMVRQVFYGQRYTQEKFGELMRVVWLPDTFGFGWQLPQILCDGGVDYFVTQKLRWNDTTEFPHGVFLWEGLDGTKIFSMMSSPIGENIESVKMANHCFDWQVKTGLRSAFWLPGVGDHGGGPTRDMLEVAKRWEMSPFFPNLQFAKAVDYLSLIKSQFFPEISDFESQVNASIQESRPILRQDEVVQNLDKAESANFPEICKFEPQGDVSIPESRPILRQDEVVQNLDEFESANFPEISKFESQVNVSIPESHPILGQDEVVQNLDEFESANFPEISKFESQVNVSIRESHPILGQDEVIGNLDEFESANSGKTSESESQVDVSIRESHPILRQDEVVQNLDKAESANFPEICNFESQGDVSIPESRPILRQDEVVGNLDDFESVNFPEMSDSESQDDVLIRESRPILRQDEVIGNLDKAESANFPEICNFESQGDVSIPESRPILRQDEVIGNLDKAESANSGKTSESESQNDVLIRESRPILRQDEVVQNLDEFESANFPEMSDSESQGDVSIPESRPILRQDEVVQNLDEFESANFPEMSEFESQGDVSIPESHPILRQDEFESQVDVLIRESHPILGQDEVIGNLDEFESANFQEMSDSESQGDVSIPESHPILGQDEVVQNLDKFESANFPEISDSESQVDVSIPESHPILGQDEVVQNLDKFESANFPEISKFESQDDVSIPEIHPILRQDEFESQVDVSIQESHPILGQDEVVQNLDEFESANSGKTSESESQNDVLIRESRPILRQDEVVQNLDEFESANFPEMSDSESQGDVSIPESRPILRQDEVVGNLDEFESANFPEMSEFESQGDVSIPESHPILRQDEFESQVDVLIRESHPILGQDEVIGNLDEFESANFQEMSDSESQGDVSIPESHPILGQDEVVQNLDKFESANFPEICKFESQDDVSIRGSYPILRQDEVIGNLDEFQSANFHENAESGNEKGDASTLPPLPIWKDELYLEFHRGCYTTRADQKLNNRRCEDLLYQAELLSSLATICAGAVYPKSELEIAWKQVLFNQFHDILPGSSIAKVYIDANLAFAEVDRTCRQILLKSLDAIASQISLPSPPQSDSQPILIFNTLNWSRSEVVALPIPDSNPENWQIYDSSGQRLVTQIQMCDRPKPQFTLLFSASDIPAIGYRVFWLSHKNPETIENSSPKAQKSEKTKLGQVTNHLTPKIALCQETHFDTPRKVLENELIRATIDGETGNLSSIWDKVNNREVLNIAGGNQLQSFQDSGQYWDAWNIDPNYQKHQLPAPILKDISWIAQGEIRQSLRVVQQIGKSEFCQDYIIEIGSPLLKIKTVVDWQEKHILVKAAFGLNVEADFATCEIPGGAIERTTKPETAAEKAKWEVPILRWVDISNNHFGVSVLNDCKYGCDIQPNQIRLTLLRGSTWPDEQADMGIHEFTYAVYPHSGNWQDAGTVQQGYELNLPLLVQVLPKSEENQHKSLPTVGKFLDLSAKNLVLMAFKQSEYNPNLWILRCYESEGKEAVLELESDLGLAISQQVNLLEQPVILPTQSDDERSFKISPWKIASFAVK